MHVIGRGRYARAVYPIVAGNGGAGATLVPLARQKFIDGDTATKGANGSIAEPFKTIAGFMASRPNVSPAESAANYVGWVMPSVAGYVENVAFPAYKSTELRADSASNNNGSCIITGNVTWANVGGANAATPFATATMHNMSVTGTVTITDDANAPNSVFICGGDELAKDAALITGLFDSHLTTKLVEALFYNTTFEAGINAGSDSVNRAVVILQACDVTGGTISGRVLESFDSQIFVDSITTFQGAVFLNTSFGSTTVLTTGADGAQFDGPSWQSFVSGGGTRGVGTTVLVTGGYNGAAVEGANLPTTGTTNVSLNGTGATAGYTGENSGNHYSAVSALTGNSTVKLLTGGGEKKGDTILITNETNTGAFTLAVENNAGAVIATIPASSRGFVLAEFNGTDWVFFEGGSLAA